MRSRRRLAGVLAVVAVGFGWAAGSSVRSGDIPPRRAELELRPFRGPRADVAALILGGRESGSLRAVALAVPGCHGDATPVADSSASEDATVPVRIWVEIEGGSLLELEGGQGESEVPESVRLELYIYVMNQAGEIVESSSEWVRVPLPELLSRMPGGGVKLGVEVGLLSGEYQVRVLARESRSQQFVLRVLGLTVPDAGGPQPFLAPPIFEDSGSAWLVARGRASGMSPPAVLPVLPTARPQTLVLRGCNLTGAAYQARLLSRNRESDVGKEVRLEVSAAPTGGRSVVSVIELPAVDPGLYVLEVSAEAGGERATATLPVFVVDSDRAASALVWTTLDGTRDESDPRAADASDPVSRAGSSKKADVIAARYQYALERLALGRLDDAVVELRRLESEILAESKRPRQALKWLAQGQNRVTRELLRQDPECLLPVLLLHLELQRRYAADRAADLEVSGHLVNETRKRIRSLAQVYAEEARYQMAASLAARSLVEMAEALEESGYLVSALVVLREALALDPGNADALLDLAYQYEHNGFFRDAFTLLQRLVELEPRSDEGRLRLAMSLFRKQRDGEAAELLLRLISDARSEWVLAVSYQELARSYLRQERFEDAVRILRKAVTRLPDVQRLYVEFAYALDRSGRRNLGSEVLARIPLDHGSPSPRLQYRVRPRVEDKRTHTELLRHGIARLPQLAAALANMD